MPRCVLLMAAQKLTQDCRTLLKMDDNTLNNALVTKRLDVAKAVRLVAYCYGCKQRCLVMTETRAGHALVSKLWLYLGACSTCTTEKRRRALFSASCLTCVKDDSFICRVERPYGNTEVYTAWFDGVPVCQRCAL